MSNSLGSCDVELARPSKMKFLQELPIDGSDSETIFVNKFVRCTLTHLSYNGT